MPCPVMPAIERYRPDLLAEAKLVGNNPWRAMSFIRAHGWERPEMKGVSLIDGRKQLAQIVIGAIKESAR